MALVTRPPKSGATVMATPMAAPHMDQARARSFSAWKVWPMTASAEVSSSAAPRPLTARATLSTNGVHASPHSSEASANTARP